MALLERRLTDPSKHSPLPVDYLKMVSEVFTSNFEEGAKALSKLTKTPMVFKVTGEIYASEIIMAVTLVAKDPKQITQCTTVYASADFDRKASAPTAQDLLNTCVDGIGTLFAELLETSALEQMAGLSIWHLDKIPLVWAPIEIDKRTIYLKVDRANPELDQLAEEWLEKNDPNYHEQKEVEAKQVEELFVTGAKAKKTLH